MAETLGFDTLATAYDRYRTGYSESLFSTLFGEGIAARDRVLDLACGTGIVTARLAAYGCAVTGVDLSEPMLAGARENSPGATLVQGSASALPFEDHSFDAVTCAQAFHWFDAPVVLDELARVLRPGGLLAVWWKRFAHDEPLRSIRDDAARDAGLTPAGDRVDPSFAAFPASSFVDRTVRTIPWTLDWTVDGFLGYERSRAVARDEYGARFEAYLAKLAARLGDLAAALPVRYLQTLYFGRSPNR